MSYYIRILGTQDPDIHLDELIAAVHAENLQVKISRLENETPDKWTTIEVANSNREALALFERNPVIEGELGSDELEEFREDIEGCQPGAAVEWLQQFFDRVKVIYAIQLLDAALTEENYPIIDVIRTLIWNRTGGIFQADHEGFSNEDGYHILWQFSDEAQGDWNCAVLNEAGEWETFLMDLGDPEQRQEFQAGKVPKKATRH
jgi:hypothetical protein